MAQLRAGSLTIYQAPGQRPEYSPVAKDATQIRLIITLLPSHHPRCRLNDATTEGAIEPVPENRWQAST